MWGIAGILLASVAIGTIEIPSLVKKKKYKDFIVFCLLLLLGTILCIAQSLRVKIPNPLDFITFVFQPISKFLLRLLK